MFFFPSFYMDFIYIFPGFRMVDSQSSTEVQHSQWRPGRFDQPKESLIWLNSFRQLNMSFLQQVEVIPLIFHNSLVNLSVLVIRYESVCAMNRANLGG